MPIKQVGLEVDLGHNAVKRMPTRMVKTPSIYEMSCQRKHLGAEPLYAYDEKPLPSSQPANSSHLQADGGGRVSNGSTARYISPNSHSVCNQATDRLRKHVADEE